MFSQQWRFKSVFWVLTPCSVAVGYQHFRRPYCFQFHLNFQEEEGGSMVLWNNVLPQHYTLWWMQQGLMKHWLTLEQNLFHTIIIILIPIQKFDIFLFLSMGFDFLFVFLEGVSSYILIQFSHWSISLSYILYHFWYSSSQPSVS
jgi:hypothetical protein